MLAVYGASSAALETPISADLGTHDLATALVFEKMGLNRQAGVVFALIIRGANLIIVGLSLLLFSKLGFRVFKGNLLEWIDRVKNNGKQGNSKDILRDSGVH